MYFYLGSFTSWNSAGALTCGARDTVPSSELNVGELRYVSILSILLCLTVSVLASCR